MGRSIASLLNPWSFRREQREQRIAELRQRDGENCRRCRRPIRFELPAGHDLAAKVEEVVPGTDSLDNLCLTHCRCNAKGGDHTAEVRERLRPMREAELFATSRKKRKAA